MTLDTSCAQNFLALNDEEPDEDLLRLLYLSTRHKVLVGVTDEAYAEVDDPEQPEVSERRLKRLGVFGRLEVPDAEMESIRTMAEMMVKELFPNQQAGSRTADHNLRDCRQLAAHKIVRRELFVTRDEPLLKRAEAISSYGIKVCAPHEAHGEVSSAQPSPATAGGVAIRPANLEADEADIRRVLSPLNADYPDFQGWLTRAFGDSRITVAESDGRIGAVAMSKKKDERVWKLSAFMVAEEYRRAGLGGHLLWSELRAWADAKLAKVYVTVSSRQKHLVPFFGEFGFVLEGVSARRYSDEHVELVLSKHFAYGDIGPADLDGFTRNVASRVLLAPEVDVPTALVGRPGGSLKWSGSGAETCLVQVEDDGTETRAWSLLEVERMFFPVVLAEPTRPVLMIPIEERWASALLGFRGEQLRLGGDESARRLLLRPDNAYYCYPTSYKAVAPGTPILFYVKNPVQALVGQAVIMDSEIALPEDLFVRFGDLGVYKPSDIRKHVRGGGPHDGKAMALRFAQYQPFDRPVQRAVMLSALGRNLSGPQGVTQVSFEDFEAVRRKGLDG